MFRRTTTLGVLAAAVLLSAPFALAGTGDTIREGQRNPSSGDATRETQIIARSGKDTYGTRQSNKGAGGGAIYGCRSTLDIAAIGDPKRSTPCIRVNNLSSGKAFDFQASRGNVIGILQAGNVLTQAKPDVSPFITNATGLALGLNADRVDGLQASELIARARAKAGLDADTLDGLDATQLVAQAGGSAGPCPAGLVRVSGGCLESAPRAAATFADASAACGAAGRRLVPTNVLLFARTVGGIDLGAGEMASDISPPNALPVVGAVSANYATVNDAGAVGGAALDTATAYRCITT